MNNIKTEVELLKSFMENKKEENVKMNNVNNNGVVVNSENTKGEDKMNNNKMEQKVLHIVDENNFFTLFNNIHEDGDSSFALKADKEAKFVSELYVAVVSADVNSRFFSLNSKSTSMLDDHLPKEYVQSAIRDNNNGKFEVAYIEKEVKVDKQSITVKTNGAKVKELMVVPANKLGIMDRAINNPDAATLRGSLEEVVGEFSVWKPDARTNSNARSGDLEFIPSTKNYTTRLENELKFNLDSYAKEVDNHVEIKTSLSSRTKLAGSSGNNNDAFKGLEYVETKSVSFDGLDGEVVGEHYVFNDNGVVDNQLVLNDDFQVILEQEVVMPEFNNLDGITISSSKLVEFTKEATDGSIYIDAEYAALKGITNDLQVRITPVIKGMLNIVKGLNKALGYNVIYFGGSVKGNPAYYFEQGHMDFFVLGEARSEVETEDNFTMISSQLARELEKRNPEILDVLEDNSKDILTRAYNQEEIALNKFVGLDKDGSESKELDSENLTAEMFAAYAGAFKQSAGFGKRLADFLRKSTQELESAKRYYSIESGFRHMVSDPYEVVRHMSKGRMGYDAINGNDKMGIAPGHVVSSRLVDGKYDVDFRKGILGRFPMLYQLEIQVVNETGNIFLSKAMENFYRGQIMQGKHQGVLYYSIYDMTAEAQSGGDFDGDTTLDIRNEEITSLIESAPKFLDYSILDGEIVEGVPWKEDLSTPINNIISAEKVEYLDAKGVSYNEGVFSLDKATLEDELVREYIYKTIINLDTISNDVNNIGRFTNINASVLELITVMEERRDSAVNKGELALASNISDEMKGYKKLNLLIAAAIRWEIDKAKHGGQFYNEMTFLDALLNPREYKDLDSIVAVENEYGIKMIRLFESFANMNDSINKGLEEAGISRINLERNEDYAGKLNLSSTIYLGKGLENGVNFNSRFNKYIDEMVKISDANTRQIRVNEMKNGFYNESVSFVNFMKNERNIDLGLTPTKAALQNIAANPDNFIATNPVELVELYKREVYEIQKEINEVASELRSAYEEQVGSKVVNIEKLSLEVLVNKLNLDIEESAPVYELEARKQLIMDKYKSAGEKFTPEDSMESALLFAELYAMNIRTNVTKRNNKLNDESEVNKAKYQATKHLQALWTEKHGSRKPNAKEIMNINNWIEKYYVDFLHNDSGLSSIITLFPLSTIQFLEVLKDGVINTESSKGMNAVVFMELLNTNLPEDVKEVLRNIEGQSFVIEGGKWGELSVNIEDLAGVNKTKNISNKDFAHLNDVSRREELSNMKFNRGAHLWNGNRKVTVALAVVYDSGVKLFLEDTKEVR